MLRLEGIQRVDRIEVVSAFERDDGVVLTCGQSLKALASELTGQVVQLSVPDAAPPELPRAVVKFERVILNLGLNRAQILVQPPSHVASSPAEAFDFARSQVKKLLRRLYQSGLAYEWTGIIGHLEFPQDDVTSAEGGARILFDSLMTIGKWNSDDLSTFEMKIGRKAQGYYHGFILSGYVTKHFEVEVTPNARQVSIDAAGGETIEAGIQIAVDVNNRPSETKTEPTKDLGLVMEEHDRIRKDLSSIFRLEE